MLLSQGALPRGSRGRGCGAAARGPVPLVQPDDGMVQKQMVMKGLSRVLQRWHGDGTEVLRLAALTQASPWAVSLCNYRPSRRSCNSYSTPENVQENTGQSSWQTVHRFYLKEDEHAFSKHLLETADIFNVKKKRGGHMRYKIDSWEKRKNTQLFPTGLSPQARLLVNLSWQHLLLEFPSYRDNLNDNVIFVHKLIYPLSWMEVWGKRLLNALMSLQNRRWWCMPFQCTTVRLQPTRTRLKSFLSRASIRLKGKQ